MASSRGIGGGFGAPSSGPMSLSDMESMFGGERDERRGFDPDRITHDDIMGLTEGYDRAPVPGSARENEFRGLSRDDIPGGRNESLRGPIGNLGMAPAPEFSFAPGFGQNNTPETTMGYASQAGISVGPPSLTGVARDLGAMYGVSAEEMARAERDAQLSARNMAALSAQSNALGAPSARQAEERSMIDLNINNALADLGFGSNTFADREEREPERANRFGFTDPYSEGRPSLIGAAMNQFTAPFSENVSRVGSFANANVNPFSAPQVDPFSFAGQGMNNPGYAQVANALATPAPEIATRAVNTVGYNQSAPPNPVANPNRGPMAAAPVSRAPEVASYSSRGPSRSVDMAARALATSPQRNPFGDNPAIAAAYGYDTYGGPLSFGGPSGNDGPSSFSGPSSSRSDNSFSTVGDNSFGPDGFF